MIYHVYGRDTIAVAATKQKTKRTSGGYVTIYLDRSLYRQFQHEALARKLTVGKVIKERLSEQERNTKLDHDQMSKTSHR